ncbi:MAG: YbjQ family protein [Gemmatimonadetes bacterium]|nr:YbjQ family protein [Gemmatimonadota bacterium]MCY3611921.1 YbjQ family protein [Gemmatimonadota bacterium]MCY3679714.1 YbjQ family protein [Gemmatimonadota bacterium]MYA43236.1 YbjQ family protein [Gemmatimonadota bacterium]MYE92181.1 YbjQ family protein [Gemmatimonadota bacterium]
MIVVNTETVPGHQVVEALGVVRGSTIRAKHIGRDIMAGLRNIVGGEVKEYTEMLTETRNESVYRMKQEARAMGADAVVNLRFTTSQVMSGAAELLAYGTAVKIK